MKTVKYIIIFIFASGIISAQKQYSRIALLNGIAHLLLKWGKIDTLFIDECTNGFSKYAMLIQSYTPEMVARRCGIRIDHLLLSPQAADRLQSVEIIKSARAMDKASDHVPIVATFG